jgi:hypothetical protein
MKSATANSAKFSKFLEFFTESFVKTLVSWRFTGGAH